MYILSILSNHHLLCDNTISVKTPRSDKYHKQLSNTNKAAVGCMYYLEII